MQLETILKQYGLNQKQAKVYLATLELGSASVSKIAEKANLPRSTTYITLENLQEKGLASSFKKKSIKWFSAQDPKTVIDLAKQKLKLIEESLPQFLAIYATATAKPDVRFYQGNEGVHLILEEILAEAKELLSFSSTADLFKAIEDYPNFVKRRVEHKISVRVIARDSDIARERKKTGQSQLRQMKLMPADFPHHGTIYIWANKVAILSFGYKTSSLVIESEEMMLVQKSMFEMIWEALPN
ncbi:MAG: helix-turn-helix domain-containing protein [Patescibacteria group bacterium]|nr:helix-turn-helix domain-containing protein [Patescibacteria group bacterium]